MLKWGDSLLSVSENNSEETQQRSKNQVVLIYNSVPFLLFHSVCECTCYKIRNSDTEIVNWFSGKLVFPQRQSIKAEHLQPDGPDLLFVYWSTVFFLLLLPTSLIFTSLWTKKFHHNPQFLWLIFHDLSLCWLCTVYYRHLLLFILHLYVITLPISFSIKSFWFIEVFDVVEFIQMFCSIFLFICTIIWHTNYT